MQRRIDNEEKHPETVRCILNNLMINIMACGRYGVFMAVRFYLQSSELWWLVMFYVNTKFSEISVATIIRTSRQVLAVKRLHFNWIGIVLNKWRNMHTLNRIQNCHGELTFSNHKNFFNSILDWNLRKKLIKCHIWSRAFCNAGYWILQKVYQKYQESSKCGAGKGWRSIRPVVWKMGFYVEPKMKGTSYTQRDDGSPTGLVISCVDTALWNT